MSTGPYWVGDVPTEDVVVVPSRGGQDINLAAFREVRADLFDPDGVFVPLARLAARIAGNKVAVSWPGDSAATVTTTYGWEGAPGESASLRSRAGVLTRNESVNPFAATTGWRANNNAAATAARAQLPSSPPGTSIKTGTVGQSVSSAPAVMSVYDIDGLGPAPTVAARSAGVWVLVNAEGYAAKIGTVGDSTPLVPGVWTWVRSSAPQSGANGGSLFVNKSGTPAATDRAWATGSRTTFGDVAPITYFDGNTPTSAVTTPGTSVLTTAGTYALVLTLISAQGGTERADSIPIVVEANDGWHTLDTARDAWVDAHEIDDDQLEDLLTTARIQCEAYAPKRTGLIPVNYRQGQIMQARNLWQSVKSDPAGNIGPDGMAIPTFPLDWVVKAVLRPKKGRPSFGF